MIKIITDSSANISQQEAAQLGITVIPLTLIFGGKEYRDGIDMQSDEFFQKLVSGDEFPHTAQISEEQLVTAYTEACKDGSDVLIMPISSGISGSHDLCCSVAKRKGFEKVHVYNTLCTTVMLRMLVEVAVKNREKPVKEVISILDDVRSRMKLYAALNTLEYLKKGGRLNSAVATIGSLLKIKPVITVSRKGKIDLVSKQLGMPKALKYLEDAVNNANLDETMPVYYIYSMDDTNCRTVMEKTKTGKDAVPMHICPVIGAHIGPSAAGVIYVEKK
ncbi:MAG: DegV family protein [Clostridia bacterium]|nr:DegV family protein [Clostridia bacterium]